MPATDKRRKRLTAVIIAAVVMIAAVIFYASFDPSSTRWMPRCMLRTVTGFDCPGCGMQRALYAALHGDFAAAWHYNPFIFFALPVSVCYIVIELSDSRFPKLRRIMFARPVLISLCVAILAWWIGRNL